MKTCMSIALAFLLALSVVPAMAADQADQTVDQVPATFQAFNNLSAPEREALTPLTDTELAAIEGSFLDMAASSVDLCVVCLNIAIVEQTNAAAQTASSVFGEAENSARQSNYSRISQEIN